LDEWASAGIEPPPSQLPKIANGSLVDLQSYRKRFPRIPGVQVPQSFFIPFRLDYGPRWRTEGIVDNVPPKVGAPYGNLVPQVDRDGNELAGIHLPDIAVPLATNVGWRLRAQGSPAAGTLERWQGSQWPFARTPEDARQSGDPRRSILERYPSKAEYLARVTQCVLELKRQRFLLDEDVANLLQQAERQEHWDK
jgi:hypothetical protein